MSKILINGQVFTKESTTELQAALKAAYARKEHPLCLCIGTGIAMYISKIKNEIYLLKRMPKTGLSHDIECPSFEMPYELSGRADLQGSGISIDETTGVSTLKFDFSLSKKKNSSPPPEQTSGSKTDVEAVSKKLTLRSLMHYLFDEAGFCKWTARMEGKRNWFVIEKYIRQATLNKIAKGEPLDQYLLIPAPFTDETQQENKKVRRDFIHRIKQTSKSSTRLGMVFAEVKEITPSKYGYKLTAKHMPELPLFFDEKLHKKIHSVFALELSMFEQDGVHLMLLATFTVSPAESLSIEALTFITVNKNWMPFDGPHELRLIDYCIRSKRSFFKPLRYNTDRTRSVPSIILNDPIKPKAIYLVDEIDETNTSAVLPQVESSEVEVIHLNNTENFETYLEQHPVNTASNASVVPKNNEKTLPDIPAYFTEEIPFDYEPVSDYASRRDPQY